MKIKTAVDRVWEAINHNEFKMAEHLMQKYRRKFGNRHFAYWMRLHIKNGLYFYGE